MPNLPAGSNVYGLDFPPSQFDQDWTLISNITDLDFTPGSPEVAVSVTAPSSGRVFVAVGCGLRNDAASDERLVVTYRFFEDGPDGALASPPFEVKGVSSCGIVGAQEFQYHGNQDLILDLEPGRQYYFQMVYMTINGFGTADIASHSILVIPVP